MRKKYATILALFLTLIMILSVPVSAPASDKTGEIQGAGKVQTTIPAASYAEGTDAPAAHAFQPESADRIIDYGVIEPVIEVNPLYADILDPDEIAEWIADEDVSDEPLVSASEPVVATTEEDFALLYRQAFEEMISSHRTSCEVTYEYTQADPISDKKKDEIRERIYLIANQNRFIHNGNPTAGDYASFQYSHMTFGGSYYTTSDGTSYTLSFTYNTAIYYYTTIQQEAELTQRLNDVMSELDLDSRTDYEK